MIPFSIELNCPPYMDGSVLCSLSAIIGLMEIETIFFILVAVFVAGIAMISAARVYQIRQRDKKAFNYNPWN